VGGFREPPIFLKPGDSVEIDVEGVGVLANHVRRSTA
jgi:2-keto-4-pentenoate hydratase/2-oxohepta-3-ene-1,7-dioic acid hydratase in catechol pathway